VSGSAARAGAGEVEVWRIDLASDGDMEADFALLDAEERARARRFRFAEHGRRFVVAHAALRSILARRVGAAPRELRFSYGTHGKPFLAEAGAPAFSLSHSHEMALCAVAPAGEIGVDVEWCRELPHADLADRFFAADEAAALRALPEEGRAAGFFACWTRKEAYVKAKGLGLSLSLQAFSVTADPGEAPALLASAHAPTDVARYVLWEIPVSPGYRAALAYDGGAAAPPCCLDWPPAPFERA
jgi:4'-phosphopantetheinyl transferase